MDNNFTYPELFWDSITRERIDEVGEDRPFDLMYRGKYLPESKTVRGVELGQGEPSVEVDMVNVDMESFSIRIYDVEFGSAGGAFRPDLSVQKGSELGKILEETENDWGYNSSMILFDRGRSYERPEEDLVKGRIYWPESTQDHPEDVYRDVEKILGNDIISGL